MKNRFFKTAGILMMGIFLSCAHIFITGANAMNNTNTLTKKQESIAQIAALTAAGDTQQLNGALKKGLEGGLTVNEIKEELVQLYAYAGFPRALNALGVFQNVLSERAAQGIADPVGESGKELPQGTDKFAYGNTVQIKLTGAPVQGGLMDFAPAIDTFLKEHLFADIFGRGVLGYQDREVATIAALAAMTGVQSQLASHIGIGLNVGLTGAQIKDIAAIVGQSVSKTQETLATQTLEEVLKRREK